jgi:UDP-N-acetylglucosamine--N-acetylmuramyl-(pentapeptide) pyrophosphoryl-undecaprenol N-acetylglucosamine transferase
MNRLVLLAGGGTVGHLAPGFALRDALRAHGVRALFVTPGEARERDWFPAGDPAPIHVPAPRLPREALLAAAFPGRLAAAVHRARLVLRRTRPAAVVALGGWPCAPAALAALSARVPLVLLATDAVPGVVVRRLQPLAVRTYVPTEEARAALPRPARGVVVGRPVRREVLEAIAAPERFGLQTGRRTLLVTGGSLGAKALNAAAVAGLAAAVRERPPLRDRLQVIHSTGGGPLDAAEVARAHERAGVSAYVTPFLREMGAALATADLVLCRGGASTLAEVEALCKPAVVVPYPHHADRQQWRNAEPLVAGGAAVVVEEGALGPEVFAREVVDLLLDEGRLGAMGEAARRARSAADGSPGGPAAAMADDLVRWMERRRCGGAAFPRRAASIGRPAPLGALVSRTAG